MPNILKAKIGGVWVPIIEPPLDEVWVSAVSPDPVGTFELWHDLSNEPPILKVKMPNSAWVPIAGQNEVAVAPLDPYTTVPAGTTVTCELWYDTTRNALYAREGVEWVPVQTPVVLPENSEEVVVGTADPYVADPNAVVDLWYQPSTGGGPVPPQGLYARVGNVWQPIGLNFGASISPEITAGIQPNPGVAEAAARADHTHGTPPQGEDEVAVGPADPYIAEPTMLRELWYNSAANDQALYARVNNAWQRAGPGFGTVVPELTPNMSSNPGTSDQASRSDHRHGTPAGSTDEVWIGASAPTDPGAELWLDTSP